MRTGIRVIVLTLLLGISGLGFGYVAGAAEKAGDRPANNMEILREKIKADKEPLEAANKATAHMYIENPLRNETSGKWMNSLFATHPDIDDRIARLRGMTQ